ncbi:MAG: lysylphosphatidylglycerol synthase transmembrane domain-containing protein [Candidatus Binatia bacterium]
MIRLCARIAVATIVLVVLASRVDLAEVRNALVAASRRDVALATVWSFTALLVIAFRLRVLLTAQGVPARLGQMFAINLSAFFYNLFLPIGGVGVAALRLQKIAHGATGRLTVALTAIVCDRLTAVAALGFVGLVCWIADAHSKPAGGLFVLFAGLSTSAVLIAPRIVPLWLRRSVRELQMSGHGTWWSAALTRLSHALGSVARMAPSALARIFGISILAQIPGILVFVALGHGLGLSVSPLSMGWVRSVVTVLTLLPISIGGVGIREGALVFTLQSLGVPAHDALALSLLVFATTILAPGLAGGAVEAAHLLGFGVIDARGRRVSE